MKQTLKNCHAFDLHCKHGKHYIVTVWFKYITLFKTVVTDKKNNEYQQNNVKVLASNRHLGNFAGLYMFSNANTQSSLFSLDRG